MMFIWNKVYKLLSLGSGIENLPNKYHIVIVDAIFVLVIYGPFLLILPE